MLKKNILANLLGNIITALVAIVCIPIYVYYLGVESYGLIGIFASLQVIFSVLDMGLSATLNREFARLSVHEDGVIEQKNLLRTFEYIYIGIAVIIGLVVILFSAVISRYWLSGSSITSGTIQFVLIQMGILLALRWPTALYAGGLTGLQKQVLYNIINTGGEVIKAIGAIAVLAFVNNSIISFFYWQIIITCIILLTLHIVLWKTLAPTKNKPFFSKELLVKNKAFATGIGATSLVVIILTQADKIILSKILDLKTFGYFTLATAISSSLFRIIFPVSQAVYPRLVQLVHSKKQEELIKTFHIACQFIALVVLPVSLVVIFFSKEVVLIWTQSHEVTASVYPLLRILMVGAACNALVTIPYMTQLAYGWTKLGFYQNLIAIIILIPSIIYLTNIYGAYGAVWVWSILNASYIVISMPVMFARYLKTEKWKWYNNDVFRPVFWGLLLMSVARILFDFIGITATLPSLVFIAFSGFFCFFTILYLAPDIKNTVYLLLARRKKIL